MNQAGHQELYNTVSYLFAGSKGLLAADESNKSATRRFEALNIKSTPETRRKYREMLFTTPGIEQWVSGVILYDETWRQSDHSDTPLPQLLAEKAILPGIKVDKGLVDFTNFAPEQVTEGLDGLAARLQEYAQGGARFTKWRAVFQISPTTPTDAVIHFSATQLARYAALAQAAGLVPIVEPEVLYDGHHSLEQSSHTIVKVMTVLFQVLLAYRVDLQGLILKSAMALPGKDDNRSNDPQAVADATLSAFASSVPHSVGGVVFLSGGQTPVQATQNLAAITARGPQPWPLTFSYSRAVQEPAMKLWLGRADNVRAAQDAFAERLRLNAAARAGQYRGEDE